MDEAEFDKFATEYRAMHAANIKASGESPEYFAEYKIVDLVRDSAALGALSAEPRILDFGAGVGYSVPFFARHLPAARVTCLDVSQKSLEVVTETHQAVLLITKQHLEVPVYEGSEEIVLNRVL